MHPQIITTEQGEELVVFSRRDYDALLARLGEEEAEDRMTLRLAEEAKRRIASGEESFLNVDEPHRGAASGSNSSGK